MCYRTMAALAGGAAVVIVGRFDAAMDAGMRAIRLPPAGRFRAAGPNDHLAHRMAGEPYRRRR